MAFAYVERLLDHPGRVADALKNLEGLQKKIISRNLYPDPEEYFDPLRSLIHSIEFHSTARKLTPELLLRKFQSDGTVVAIYWAYGMLIDTPQNQIGLCFSSG